MTREAAKPAPARADPAPVQILHGVPKPLRAPVAALYWRHFGRQILPLPLRAARGEALLLRALRPDHALLAVRDGRLLGAAGLRDAAGGLMQAEAGDFAAIWGPRRGPLLERLARLSRGGAATTDLVLDGVAVVPEQRRQGIARLLVAAAAAQACARGHPGLRAEVRAGDHAARAAWLALGFQPQGQERLGWPWSAPAHVLRLRLGDQPSLCSARSSAATS